MVYSGPQPISPFAGVLDDDLLNTYSQLFPEGKPQKPQYQSSSLAGSYQDFLGSPSSSSGSGQNTDWGKYVDNHADLKQAYLDYESQTVANGDVPKPKWAWGRDHYQEFGKNESGRNLTGVSENLIEEVTGPPAMTSYDQITQAIIDRDTNNNNANAQINALNRESDDYKTDVTSFTDITGSLIGLQGIREGEEGALERLQISENAATARQDSVNETQLGVETLRGSNAIDLQEITNSGLAAVESIRQAGAENIANIQKEASDYAVDSENDWRKYGAQLDTQARLGVAQAQKEGVLGAADIRGKADIRVGELQSEASKFAASKDAEARLGAAQAQKEAILGAENIKAKGALDLQPIINAGLANVARLNKEAALGTAEITGKYGVEEEKVRGMSAKDVAKIQSRGNVFGSLVSAFNF